MWCVCAEFSYKLCVGVCCYYIMAHINITINSISTVKSFLWSQKWFAFSLVPLRAFLYC